MTAPAGPELLFERADVTWDPVANLVRFVEFVPDDGSTVTITYETP